MADGALLYGAILDGKGGARELTWEQVQTWTPDDGILWLHLDRTDPEAERWVREESGVDEAVAETLLAASGNRPRVQRIDDNLLIILRGINVTEGEEKHDMVGLHLWITGHMIVSLRRRRLAAGQELQRQMERGDGPTAPGDFLVHMTDFLMEHTSVIIDGVDDAVDELQQQVIDAKSSELRTKLRTIRQECIELRRYLSPQRDALLRLPTEKISWLTDLDRSHLREIADRNARFVEDLDSARERAAVTQDELSSQMADRMNQTMYVLTIISAIFLPPALLTGLFGINVGGMPWVEASMGFTLITGSMFVIALFEIWLLRRLKWI